MRLQACKLRAPIELSMEWISDPEAIDFAFQFSFRFGGKSSASAKAYQPTGAKTGTEQDGGGENDLSFSHIESPFIHA